MNRENGFRQYFSNFLYHGGTGVLASVLIILIFLLCATWLKSLVFGVLLACILLPLERFYEEKVFGRRTCSPEEQKKKERQKKVFKASFAAFLTLIIFLILIVFLAFAFLIPLASELKQDLNAWGKRSPVVEKIEAHLLKQERQEDGSREEKGLVVSLRKNLRELANEKGEMLASFARNRGKDIVTVLYKLLKGIGYFMFDIFLSIFFGFYFLQKIAYFEGVGKERRSRFGEWLVNLFFDSPWLPEVSRRTRWQTVRIITHIGGILTRWVRGYFTVISIEMILYILLFTVAGVPYSLLAGIIAGLTVLLPFIGPVISFCLTVALCIAFCESSLFLTLIFVSIIYLLINGMLEQFFLYPSCIGEVSGLTTVETIIVVLIGGIAAGIPGMIFAIPAAAVIKYIIPFFYKAASFRSETDT